jgi:hypothetical protein
MMSAKPGRLVIYWGHLALLAGIVGLVLFYWLDVRSVSLRPTNLLMIEPGAIFALLMAALVVPQCFRRVPEGEEEQPESLGTLGRVFALMGTFAAFALTLEWVGFDIGTFVFMVVGLFICGERNWLLNIGFSAAFTLFIVWGYGAITPFPFPLTLL